MGTANQNKGKKNNQSGQDANLVSVETIVLKDRLNKLYQNRRGQATAANFGGKSQGEAGLFDYLWDLKEKALIEHRATVDVPATWLNELEQDLEREQSIKH